MFELYGIPRLRAGAGRVAIDARNIAEALDGLAAACPGLVGSILEAGSVLPAYKLNLNSERFVSDPSIALGSSDVLILLSADVGG